MRRREFMMGAGTALSIGTTGCLSQARERDELAVEASGPKISPGETATITAYGYNVQMFRFGFPMDQPLKMEDQNVSPSADKRADSSPPIWAWDETQSSVEATLTLSLPSDAEMQEYTYHIEAANGDHSISADYEIDVSE